MKHLNQGAPHLAVLLRLRRTTSHLVRQLAVRGVVPLGRGLLGTVLGPGGGAASGREGAGVVAGALATGLLGARCGSP